MYTTTQGNKINLYCIADANPLLANHITWKSKDKPLVNTETEEFYTIKFIPPNLSVLTINKPRDVDDGNISCTVANGIGKGETAFTELRVRRVPIVLTDESTLKAGEDSNMGRTASFRCVIRGFPDSTFKWKTPGNTEITNSSKYSIVNTKSDNQKQVSILFIHSITSSDYGTYLCEPRNDLGLTMGKAILSGKRNLK